VCLFELFWCLVVEATVQVPVVPQVDPSSGGPFDIRDGAVWPGMEHCGADAFGLELPDHGLHQRVIERIGHGPDRGADALELEMLDERDRRVLAAGVGVADEFPGFDGVAFALALPGRHP